MSDVFRRMGGMLAEGVRYWVGVLTGRSEKPAPEVAARPDDTAGPAAPPQAEGAGKYRVLVDDNFDYMDESRRCERGQYDTVEEAIGACKELVDAWLQDHYQPGMTAEELEKGYKMFGDDPFVPGVDPETFSAWRYASRRARKICGGGS